MASMLMLMVLLPMLLILAKNPKLQDKDKEQQRQEHRDGCRLSLSTSTCGLNELKVQWQILFYREIKENLNIYVKYKISDFLIETPAHNVKYQINDFLIETPAHNVEYKINDFFVDKILMHIMAATTTTILVWMVLPNEDYTSGWNRRCCQYFKIILRGAVWTV
ncbi:unnamed protein product [Symbiodinium sp. CCMP2592]|nr:unnamed protein product [Symbiodinium sp. CCMP2592]